MTRNQHYAIKIISRLENGMDASVEYHAGKDSVDFYYDYDNGVKCITIYNRDSDEEAQEALNAIMKAIKGMKRHKEDTQA